MAEILTIFGLVASIILIGFLAEILFERTKVPDVIILISLGIMLGFVFSDVGPKSFEPWSIIFTTFTLVFMLFQGALSIKLDTLFKAFGRATTLTVVSFFLTAFVVTLFSAFIMGFPFLNALLLGMILGGTSSAVVIPLITGLKLKLEHGLVLTLESAISDVLAIIGSLTVLSIITTGALSPSGVVKNIISSFSLALVIGAAAGVFWIILLARSPRVKNSYMLTIAAIMALYAFVESAFVLASGAIAALVFGLIVGNSKSILRALSSVGMRVSPSQQENVAKNVLSSSAKSFYDEIGFFVKVFFFVYLGMLIDFSEPLVFLFGAILTLIIYIARPLAVRVAYAGVKLDDKHRVALQALIPKGLAAAVLAQLAVQYAIPGSETIVGMVLSVILLSILCTSILVFLGERGLFKGLFKEIKS